MDQSVQQKQLNWLVQQLEIARETGRKVYLVAHIEPGADELSQTFSYFISNMTDQYQDEIVASFWGHTHNNEFRLFFKEDEIIPTHVAYIAAAMKPGPANMPGFRIYEYNRQSNELLDFYQYFLNLTDVILGGKIEYQFLYSAKQSYGLTDLSAKSWNEMLHEMKNNRTNLVNLYSSHFFNGKNVSCDARCQTGMIEDIIV